MEVDIRPSFELEYTMMKQTRSIALVNESMPNAAENTSADDSPMSYLVSIPHKLRKHPLYDTLKAFAGAAYSISTATDTMSPRGPGDAARRRMGIEP